MEGGALISEKAVRLSLLDSLKQEDERTVIRISDRIRDKCLARFALEVEIHKLTKDLIDAQSQVANIAAAFEFETRRTE